MKYGAVVCFPFGVDIGVSWACGAGELEVLSVAIVFLPFKIRPTLMDSGVGCGLRFFRNHSSILALLDRRYRCIILIGSSPAPQSPVFDIKLIIIRARVNPRGGGEVSNGSIWGGDTAVLRFLLDSRYRWVRQFKRVFYLQHLQSWVGGWQIEFDPDK
jgi:hypothetical protein